jgi:hypothetical protein
VLSTCDILHLPFVEAFLCCYFLFADQTHEKTDHHAKTGKAQLSRDFNWKAASSKETSTSKGETIAGSMLDA